MDRPKVFIAKPVPKEVEEFIAKYCDYKKWDSDSEISEGELIKNLKDVEGLLTSGTKINDRILAHSPRLKVVSDISVGYDNFEINAMKQRKVIGTNTPFVLNETVSDLIMTLIMSTARRISELDSYVKKGKWKKDIDSNLFGVDINHATLGIIGMGRIGECVARKAKFGFNMNVLYHNRNRRLNIENELGVQYESLDDLLKKSDFISVMVPYNKNTYHIIDYKEFDLMKKSAIFINASRGQTVNEKALVDALNNNKILAAGLDVYETEPIDPENPLLKMTNVITLPHIGSATAKTRFDMAMLAAENLVKAVLGKTVPNMVPELKDLV
ncbi:2-hydroxyacid dehydrogenase [Clostridium sp. MT-14]|jgi:gluconate 2-dehydrogenase|uniref:D-glycerate dehydrogenase n=1 Tax=Clostridium aromativorans TaxID=2836848 RepID=A0ABS8N5U7_9CLOT|nr:MULTISPECIES: D-glycerate dehydrogenase [Clostridium]KAA8674968.1 D-glycerate dehydrogenase [Clostridium sp. HV4-5-A1G]MCC9294440.1 D-glycerate dehydrogenase [Clostridium aromativorans]CAB1255195.1 putative 2-ketogluconate reductase; hydroxypyruvate / glyoxylate reductase [Clostridiaceae bacterium BL-3]